MAIVIHFDGLCEPKNPGGVATFGFTVDRDGRRAHEECGLAAAPYSAGATNNVAEYTGLVKALEWLLAQGLEKEPVVAKGDSELVVRQMRGEWKVKAPLLAPLHKRGRELSMKFPSLKFEWVPREENREADALTNRAYGEYAGAKVKAPTTDVMMVELVFAAPRDAVAAALRQAKIEATVTAVPGGARVQAELATDAEGVRQLLAVKARLEGTA
jgi:ribonuclease HI